MDDILIILIMDKTAEQMEKDPLSIAVREALMQVAADNEILDPLYHKRPGESDEELRDRADKYNKMPREELLQLAKEYQKSHSPGK